MSEKITPTVPPTEEKNDIVTIQFSKKSVKRKAVMALAAVGGVTLTVFVLSKLPQAEDEEIESSETPSTED
jgi:hypothetical protein